MIRILLLLFLACGCCFAQFTSTARHIGVYASAPAACSTATGDIYYNSTSKTPFFCSATNTWTAMGGGGGGCNTGTTQHILKGNGGGGCDPTALVESQVIRSMTTTPMFTASNIIVGDGGANVGFDPNCQMIGTVVCFGMALPIGPGTATIGQLAYWGQTDGSGLLAAKLQYSNPSANSMLLAGPDATIATDPSPSLTIALGNSGATSGDGGALSFVAGLGTTAGVGGQVTIQGGDGGSTSGDGGNVALVAGSGVGSGAGGTIAGIAGNGAGANPGGGFQFQAGGGGAAGQDGGSITMSAGNSGNAGMAGAGNGGNITLGLGQGDSAGAAGLLKIFSATTGFSINLDNSMASANRLQKFPNADGAFALAGTTLTVVDFSTNTTVANGQFYYTVPASLNGMTLQVPVAQVTSAGTTNTTNVSLTKCSAAAAGNACSGTTVAMLSTGITIDSGENSTATAATAPVVAGAGAGTVATNDIIRVDVTQVSATPAKGLQLNLRFQ